MSVLSHLNDTASALLSRGPSAADIGTSISTLKVRLDAYFGRDAMWEHFAFGSWKRETNLPRKADASADVDYMIVFKGDANSKPQTFLDRLRRFVDARYSTSDVKQSHPTIVLTLNHIQFELVPAVRSGNSMQGTLQIPSLSSTFTDWQSTYPSAADAAIDLHNKNNRFLSKPLVRLLKYWNCQAGSSGRSYSSFELEQIVAGQYFYPNANLKDYLYGAVQNLPVSWGLAQSKKDRIARFKEVILRVRNFENAQLPDSAETEIKKVIPAFL